MEILLSTLNARYVHAAFGLRYLLANLGELRPRAGIREFDINQRPIDIAESIVAEDPRILGLGVYLWNVALTTELVAILRRLRPSLVIVLGGPEVSHEWEDQEIVRLADHVVTGEADLAFADLCRALLSGNPPAAKMLHAPLPDLAKVAMPYELYDERDCAHRVVYVESSRGCPFTCEFCLSSLDVPVRQFPLDEFLASMQSLLDREVRQFKFVDRTFNLNLMVARRILGFFLERWTPGLFVHFEMVPDRLPAELRELIARFPAGALQFEVGIQTFEPAVEKLVSRRQDHGRLEDNLRWLRASTGVHVHADLIAGLPGETLTTFAEGFDRLLGLGPQEIQVGILKRLRGTPIIRHDAGYAMLYNPAPPYEVLSTRDLDFATLARLRRFGGFWDLFGNSGHFAATLPLLWEDGVSPFERFMAFADWLHANGGKTSGIARQRQYDFLARHLLTVRGIPETIVNERLARDQSPRRKPGTDAETATALPERQARHLAGSGGVSSFKFQV